MSVRYLDPHDQYLLTSLTALFFLLLAAPLVQAESVKLHPTFERALPNEAQLQNEITTGILHIQRQEAESHGRTLRGTHAKGVCAQAEFEILPGAHNTGAFAWPGVYPAQVRFANAAGAIEPDQTPDVRSLSFAVSLPPEISNPQGRMDFSTNNATTFPINDAEVFSSLMILNEKGLVAGGWEIGVGRAVAAAKALSLGENQKAPAKTAYQKMTYWSTVPFLFGPDQAVKYKLSPCAGNPAVPLNKDPDTLNKELARHLQDDQMMSCFDFQIQFLDATTMHDQYGHTHLPHEWVENATWEWSEEQSIPRTIARLTLKAGSLLAPEVCEGLRFNVNTNTNEWHRGLGSINRARTQAEQESAKRRTAD